MKKKLLCITPIKNIENVYSKLSSFFHILYYPNLHLKELSKIDKRILDNVEIIFTNPNRTNIYIDKNFLLLFKSIKVICTASTGTTHIDEIFCEKNNIKIISLKPVIKTMKDVSSTAELSFALMINAIRNVTASCGDVEKGNWDCEKFIGRQLNELKIGVIGFGRLGKIFSKYCLNFGATVKVYDPFVNKIFRRKNLEIEKKLENIFNFSDVISLHASVNSTSFEMINKSVLKYAKKNLIIINTARGEIVKEKDIINFLRRNSQAKYFTDVLSNETERNKNELLHFYKTNKSSGQILITPHIGGMSQYSRKRAYNLAVDQLINFFDYV